MACSVEPTDQGDGVGSELGFGVACSVLVSKVHGLPKKGFCVVLAGTEGSLINCLSVGACTTDTQTLGAMPEVGKRLTQVGLLFFASVSTPIQ